jgi:hypothetical protein
MGLLMDGLLMAASLFAGGYCWVLSRRVQDLKNLDRGLGGSIVNLTRQIELARATLEEARGASENTREELTKLVAKADSATGQLRMTLATVRVPTPPAAQRTDPPPVPAARKTRPEWPDPSAAQRARPEEREPVAGPADTDIDEVPKPRALAPIEHPLRAPRRETPAHAETDILAALAAIAKGER